jgi:hypothetical protein
MAVCRVHAPLYAVCGAVHPWVACLPAASPVLAPRRRQTIDLTTFAFAPSATVTVRDIWANTTSTATGSFTTRAVGSHETLLLRVTQVVPPAKTVGATGGEL